MTKATNNSKKRLQEIAERINQIIKELPANNSFKSSLFSYRIEENRNKLEIQYVSYQSLSKITLPEAELWLLAFEKEPCRHFRISQEYEKQQKKKIADQLKESATYMFFVERYSVKKLIFVKKTKEQIELKETPHSSSQFVNQSHLGTNLFESESDAIDQAIKNAQSSKKHFESEMKRMDSLMKSLSELKEKIIKDNI